MTGRFELISKGPVSDPQGIVQGARRVIRSGRPSMYKLDKGNLKPVKKERNPFFLQHGPGTKYKRAGF